MGPLVIIVKYSGLSQGVLIMDRVKSSSFDNQEKIPVDSTSRCFTSFSSGSSSPEVAEFCPTFAFGLCYRSGLSLHLHTIQIYSLPFKKWIQKVVSQVKELSIMAFKDLYVSRVPKNPIVIPQTASSPSPGFVFSFGIRGLTLHYVTTPLALQRVIYRFLLSLI
jgi:hypothetical protein